MTEKSFPGDEGWHLQMNESNTGFFEEEVVVSQKVTASERDWKQLIVMKRR